MDKTFFKSNIQYFFSPNKCKYGWRHGECCCNCKNQLELFKHPWNKIHKGSISETTNLYACTIFSNEENTAILFECKHGFCELYLRRNG